MSSISVMEENPILLWSIKCYKQKASDKLDLHTLLYLHIFCVYSVLPVLAWHSFRYGFNM